MSDEIKVTVVKFGDRKLLQMQYVDPVSRKKKTRSAGTAVRRDAERAAAKWEAELREGRVSGGGKILWADFRERYENEVLTSLAEGTDGKVQGVFNLLERMIAPSRLREITADRLSLFQSKLREEGRSESTIAGYMAHLKAALRWAARIGLIAKAPEITRLKRAKSSGKMKGRPISGEEFDRMIMKTAAGLLVAGEKEKPEERATARRLTDSAKASLLAKRKAAVATTAPAWQHLLNGLWLSGLRLGEALELSWDDSRKLSIDLSGEFPVISIPAELEKGHKDRTAPMAPEFAEFLLAIPEDERTGYVFKMTKRHGGRPDIDTASRTVSAIGKAAGIKVNVEAKGKVKYASAHDLRRSFGERWAARVMPQVLKELMRHESIETTLRYYVGRNAQTTASVLWDAHRKATASNTPSNTSPVEPAKELT